MNRFQQSFITFVIVFSITATSAAQTAGREPVAGQVFEGGTTLIDSDNRVSASGELRLWQAFSTGGARAMLKVYRPEGSRLVLVGTSALESVPVGELVTFECRIPVSRNDIIGIFCPDTNCVDRFSDGQALSRRGDVGTEELAVFVADIGPPAIYASAISSADVPSPAGTNLVLPVAARSVGENGTMWITSLEIFNTAAAEVEAALFFNRSGEDNTFPAASARVVLPARGTVVFEDVIKDVFSLEADAGSIDIVAAAPLIAHARIANMGSVIGSFGQYVPAYPVTWALGDEDAPGVNSNGDIAYLFEVREDENWRTNLGVANVSGVTLKVVLDAFAGTAVVGTSVEFELEPYSHIQVNHILDVLEVPLGTPRVRVNVAAISGSSGLFFAYASRVDNGTGDATYMPGVREPSL